MFIKTKLRNVKVVFLLTGGLCSQVIMCRKVFWEQILMILSERFFIFSSFGGFLRNVVDVG